MTKMNPLTIKRLLPALLAALLVMQPAMISAQGVAGYGQAMGQRRQQNRTISPQNAGGSFVETAGPSLQQIGATSSQFRPGGGDNGFQTGVLDGTGYQIHILGQVNSPGTYRLPPSTRMAEAIIQAAGGIAEKGSKRRIELRRNGQNRSYDLFRFHTRGELNQNPFLLDNDVIYVPFSKNNVEIQGPVKSPGVYELSIQDRDGWDLIQLAGGFTAGASFDQPVTIIRYEGEEKRLLEVANRQQELNAFELRNGDIAIIPHILTGDRRFDFNVAKLPGDNVFYPSFNDNVFVMGAVELPGAFPFSPNYSLRDYVNMAGPSRQAKIKRLRVLNPNGQVIARMMKKEFKLSPGDTIVVPEKSLTTDNVLKWYNTLANSIITGFTLRELIRR